jgi:hypothetical protein
MSPKFSQQVVVETKVASNDVHVFDFDADEKSDVDNNRNSEDILSPTLSEIGIKLKLTKPEPEKVNRKKGSKKKQRERASHHVEESSSDEEEQPQADKKR